MMNRLAVNAFWNHAIALAFMALASCSGSSSGSTQPPVTTPPTGGPVNPVYTLDGVNFSPYYGSQDPSRGAVASEAQVRQRMGIVAGHVRGIRTFGTRNGLEYAGRIAHELGLSATIGAWLGPDPATNAAQVDELVSMANRGEVDVAVVGSEVLYRGDLSVGQLVAIIQDVRSRIPPSIPIGYADVYTEFIRHPSLVAAVDIVMSNHYPYWEGVHVTRAIQELHYQFEQVRVAAGSRDVMISETGWPSAGDAVGSAVPSDANAAAYFLEFVSWARANNVAYQYFEATDEAWKIRDEGPQGAHWGIWDETGDLKPGMEAVFAGVTVVGNWGGSGIPGGPGQPEISLTSIPPRGSTENLRGQGASCGAFAARGSRVHPGRISLVDKAICRAAIYGPPVEWILGGGHHHWGERPRGDRYCRISSASGHSPTDRAGCPLGPSICSSGCAGIG